MGQLIAKFKSVVWLRGIARRVICLPAICLVLAFANVGSKGSFPRAMADDALTQANAALINGKYRDVVSHTGKVVANGKAQPDMMAKALLLRGIAYRNQGKIAQSIADFSNAEWLQKLRGVELRRLYAERALAYDAVGQTALATRDRKFAGSNRAADAQKGVKQREVILNGGQNGKIVRTTSVQQQQSATSEFFGGLGNLFGFGPQKKPAQDVKVAAVRKEATKTPSLREIPTIDSAEAKLNREKTAAEGALKDTRKQVVGTKTTVAPSNSAWAAQRTALDKAAADKTKKVITETTNSGVVKQSVGSLQKPVVLAPKKVKEPVSQNPVSSFFQNVFGGAQQAPETPVGAGEDIIVADQVASLETKPTKTKYKEWVPPKRAVKKSAPKKKIVKKPAAKKSVKPPQGRSLYHVQLGVFGEVQAADNFVTRLNSKYKSHVGTKTAMVVETDLGQSRRQYRVYLGPFRSKESSLKSCKSLKELGLGCTLVK